MNKILISISVVALTVVVACSSDEERWRADGAEGSQPISLSSWIGEATRSNNATNLISGDTVYVWGDMVNASTSAETMYFKAWAMTADGLGNLSPLLANTNKLFPATNSLNIYALCGNFGVIAEGLPREGEPTIEPEKADFPSTGIRHTVLNDQTTSDAYYKSDLLYAVKKNQEPISDAVVLPFRHMLSRIQVVIVAGNGLVPSELNNATVTLLGMKCQVTFSPNKAKDYTSLTDRTSMLSIPAAAEPVNILMATNTVAAVEDAQAANSMVYADAIVVPQTIAKGANFIKVEYLDNTTYYRIPNGANDEPMTFESGKQYRFRLIADRIGDAHLFDAVTVESWGAATNKPIWLDTVTQ